MEEKKGDFKPIKLINTNVITRKGYYICKIVKAEPQNRYGKESLRVDFVVTKGSKAGFQLTTYFWDTYKSRARLSYLCQAVGIFGELKRPDDLIGRTLRLRIVPKASGYKGRTYLDHRITMFHKADRNTGGT